jgi:diguanylate cyclase (GGDEF)-like protein
MVIFSSLRTRFALIVALLIISLSWIFGALIGTASVDRLREQVGRELAESALDMVDHLDRDMDGRARELTVLSQLQALRDPRHVNEAQRLLDHLQQQFPSIAWIGLTDAKGTVLASNGGILKGVSIAKRPVYLNALEELFVGDVHEAVMLAKLLPNPTGEAMKFVDISLPIKDEQGQLIGVLASHLSWGWADEVRQSLLKPTQQRLPGLEFMVVSKDHTILLGPKDMIGQKLDFQWSAIKQQSWSLKQWPDGHVYLTGFATSDGHNSYPGLGWTVVARQPLDAAYASAHALQNEILICGIVLALVFAGIGWLLAGFITKPLNQIVMAAKRLSAGENVEIPEIKGTNEVHSLSQAIRQLVQSLSRQEDKLDAMESIAYQDTLTGLANRAALERYLPQVQQRIQQQGGSLALLCLDLDGFKPVNDRFGHGMGDLLLQEVAQRLLKCFREHDLVVRQGGDEFLMLLPFAMTDTRDVVRAIAVRVIRSLEKPFYLAGETIQIGCSIGVALWPEEAAEIEEAIEQADQALYSAKRAGKGRVHFHLSHVADAQPSKVVG